MTKHPAERARPAVRELKAYTIHPEEGTNLMNNASLFGPNPVVERVLKRADPADLVDYPPIDSLPLREAAAERFDLEPEQVLAANGTNEIIDFLVRTFVPHGGEVAYHPPSFSMIPTFVRTNGAHPRAVPLQDPGWSLDPAGFLEADAELSIVCRPNNPTGNAFPVDDVLEVVEGLDGIVIADEAYVEFADGSLLPHLPDHPNLVVLRTLSKAHGLAGFRVGMALGDADVLREVGKVRAPFRLDTLSELVAVEALRDSTYVDRAVPVVRKQRERVRQALDERGFRTWPSDANFLWVEPPVDAVDLTNALRDRGFLVRDFRGEIRPYLRITLGPPDVMDAFLDAVDDALQEVRASA